MEVAIAPAGASLDHFDWRISIATIARDGAFSVFAGIDRTLCLVEGVIELRIDDELVRRLDGGSEPVSFPGDAAVHSTLIGGTATDFNVMTRRDRFSHDVRRVQLRAGDGRDVGPGVRAVFCHSGVVSVERAGGLRERLGPLDTMLREAADNRAVRIAADADAVVCLVTISERT